MKWSDGDRIEWAHMQLTRFDPRRYHGTVINVENDGEDIKVKWDDGEITDVGPDDLIPEEAHEA